MDPTTRHRPDSSAAPALTIVTLGPGAGGRGIIGGELCHRACHQLALSEGGGPLPPLTRGSRLKRGPRTSSEVAQLVGIAPQTPGERQSRTGPRVFVPESSGDT
jgi:hypothetical protein